MNFQLSNVKCKIHNEIIRFIYKDEKELELQEKDSLDKQSKLFLCTSCIPTLQKAKPGTSITDLIHINAALRDPIYLINQLKKGNNSKQILDKFFFDLKEKFNKFQQETNNLIKLIQEVQKESDKYYSQVKVGMEKLKQETLNTQPYGKFRQLMEDLSAQSGDADAVESITQDVKKYIILYRKDENNKLIEDFRCQIESSIQQLDTKFNQFKHYEIQFKQIRMIFDDIQQYVGNQFQINEVYPSRICSTEFQNVIFKRISIHKTKVKLIYSGNKAGLNSETYWEAINGKSKLLMIFQSKNGHVFGGYTPCIWRKEQSGYLSDNTYTSFIFSENNNMIYPLKKNCQQALFFSNDYVVQYSADLVIGKDFTSGFSKLGQSYDSKFHDGTSEKSDLYGQQTPNVIDCEVFQII